MEEGIIEDSSTDFTDCISGVWRPSCELGIENNNNFRYAIQDAFIKRNPEEPFSAANDFSGLCYDSIVEYYLELQGVGYSKEEINRLIAVRQQEILDSRF